MAHPLLTFPNPVNEKAARTVATLVAAFAVLILATGWQWLLPVMALGFLLRVLAGPRLSPFGLLATKVVAPRLGEQVLVPGPPKRFAQTVGLLFTTSASIAGPLLGQHAIAAGLLAVLLVFAFLEAALNFCAGCWVFAQLMRLGLVPEETCAACNDIRLRRPAGQPAAA
jgi:hypothetical protein